MKIFIIGIGISIITLLGSSIDSYNQSFLTQKGITGLNQDIFYKTFGEFKNYLSDTSFVKADVYYHGGVYAFKKDCEACNKEQPHIIDEKDSTDKDEHFHEHEHVKDEARPSLNILLDISEAMHISTHRHLRGNEEKEIVPWMYYAVRLNPHNEIAYSVGGYWLAINLKKTDEGIKLLKEGFSNNPESWEICATLGQIYLLHKGDYGNAITYLEKAKELGEKQNIDSFGKKRIYIFLAEAYKKSGNVDKYKELTDKIEKLSFK